MTRTSQSDLDDYMEETSEWTRIVQTVRFSDHDDIVVFRHDVSDPIIVDVAITTKAWYHLGCPGTLTVEITPASAPAVREKEIP